MTLSKTANSVKIGTKLCEDPFEASDKVIPYHARSSILCWNECFGKQEYIVLAQFSTREFRYSGTIFNKRVPLLEYADDIDIIGYYW